MSFKKPTKQLVQPATPIIAAPPSAVVENTTPKQRVVTPEDLAWAAQAGATPAKKRSQPKRKNPPKILRSYRLPQELLDRIEAVSNDVGLPDYSVVELLLNEALKARGLPKGAISHTEAD